MCAIIGPTEVAVYQKKNLYFYCFHMKRPVGYTVEPQQDNNIFLLMKIKIMTYLNKQ